MRTSVMIATHNRCEDLRRTLQQLQQLDPAPLEILVCADGCTDGTIAMLKKDFTACRLIEQADASGSVASRNRLLREAKGELVLSLDDDSYPEEKDFLARAEQLFASSPRLAVASFPQRTEEFPESMSGRNFPPSHACASYKSSGALLRRDVYLELPGYYPLFFHAYEEPDYSLQCWAQDWEVRFFPELIIRHHYSQSGRDEIRIHHFHARNELWSVWLRCPFPWAPAVSLYRVLTQAGYAAKRGLNWLAREPEWWIKTLQGLSAIGKDRSPVKWGKYKLWLKLLRNPQQAPKENFVPGGKVT